MPSHVTRRTVLRLLGGGVGLSLVAACAPIAPSNSAPTSAAAPKPTGGSGTSPNAPAVASNQPPQSGGTLHIGMTGELTSLDGHRLSPQNSQTVFAVFDSLTRYDEHRQPQPMLAESWAFSSDQKQLKLNLRKGVQFHTGREFTSEDVKFNVLRVRDPSVGTAQLAFMSNWWTDIQTPDKNTVILVSEQPRPAAFDMLEFLNIMDPVTLQGADSKSKAVGTGPFTFGEWAQGDHATFTKNKNYWMSGQPYLDQVQVHLFGDGQAMVSQFEAGVLNAMFNPLLIDTVRLQKNTQYQVVANAVPSSDVVIAMNTSNQPLDNKQVRQALNHALNRQRFTQTVMQGMTQPISLPWPPQSPAYDAAKNQTYSFNLDKAKSLLASAGVSNLQLDFLYSSISPELANMAQMYQADLASIGVQLALKPLESAVFNDLTNTRKYTGLAASNAGFVQLEPSSLAALSVWFKPGTNNEAFASEQYAQLVNTASVEPDPSKRLQLYGQLNDLLLDESFVIIPSHLTQLVVTTSNMRGLQWRLGQSVRYEETWIA